MAGNKLRQNHNGDLLTTYYRLPANLFEKNFLKTNKSTSPPISISYEKTTAAILMPIVLTKGCNVCFKNKDRIVECNQSQIWVDCLRVFRGRKLIAMLEL